MHVHGFSNVMQYHWPHGFFTFFEEVLLARDDFTGDLQEGFIAAEDAFNKPAGFLKVTFQVCVVRAVISPFDQIGVAVINT